MKTNVRMIDPSSANKEIFRNWAIVNINPKEAIEKKDKGTTSRIVTPDDRKWLVPFAIGGVPMQAIYVLQVDEISIHGQRSSSMCEMCLKDIECISNGRGPNGDFQCPGGWDGLTHIRRSAR